MPRLTYKVAPQGDLASLRRELNTVLGEMSTRLGQLEGTQGSATKFHNDIDLNGHSIINVGKTGDSNQVATIDDVQQQVTQALNAAGVTDSTTTSSSSTGGAATTTKKAKPVKVKKTKTKKTKAKDTTLDEVDDGVSRILSSVQSILKNFPNAVLDSDNQSVDVENVYSSGAPQSSTINSTITYSGNIKITCNVIIPNSVTFFELYIYDASGNGYYAQLGWSGSVGAAVGKITSTGTITTLGTSANNYSNGQHNIVFTYTTGNFIELTVDGTTVIKVSDSTYTPDGPVGYATSNVTENLVKLDITGHKDIPAANQSSGAVTTAGIVASSVSVPQLYTDTSVTISTTLTEYMSESFTINAVNDPFLFSIYASTASGGDNETIHWEIRESDGVTVVVGGTGVVSGTGEFGVSVIWKSTLSGSQTFELWLKGSAGFTINTLNFHGVDLMR